MCGRHLFPSRGGQRSRFPEALEDIVMRCLRKEPGERPAGARQLARELEALDLARSWSEERAQQWWLDHPPARLERGSDGTEISPLWLVRTRLRLR